VRRLVRGASSGETMSRVPPPTRPGAGFAPYAAASAPRRFASGTVDGRTWPSTDAWGIALIDPVAVEHEGHVVVFAREQGVAANRLYYNVRQQLFDSAF